MQCGLVVAAGDSRCPRCRTSLSARTVLRPDAQTSIGARNQPRGKRLSVPPGGTSVEKPRISSGRMAAGIAVVAAMGIAAAFSLGRGGVAPARTALPQPEQSVGEIVTQIAAPLPFEDPGSDSGAVPVTQTAALEQLRRAFAKARLYSQISVRGDEMELRSTSCGATELGELLEQSRSALSDSGIRRVRCLQPHGQVVFSRAL